MNVDGKPYRTIWVHPEDPAVVQIIDQRDLPHRFVIEDLSHGARSARRSRRCTCAAPA